MNPNHQPDQADRELFTSDSCFGDLALPLQQAIHDMGYDKPTPIQTQSIPYALQGKDILGTAQTGTGKTAAFALPLLTLMLQGRNKPALVVAPTRELAEQIGQMIDAFTQHVPHLRTAVIIGGSSYPRQIRALRSNPMVVVGTPGRLLDQMKLGHLSLKNFGALVIDEADRLLDMGFEPQMNELVMHLPADRQGLIFSATMPNEILKLAGKYLKNPERVAIGEVSKPIEKIRQSVVHTTASAKDQTLVRELDKVAGSIIIFTKTKWKTEKLARFLSDVGHEVTRIHGDRSQKQRSTAISDFRDGTARILVATDIAARGLDIPHIQHVVNYDLPMCPEDFIHRIGRTARAGAEGHSLSFITPEDQHLWERIYKLMHGHYPDAANGGRTGSKAGRPQTANRQERRGKSFGGRRNGASNSGGGAAGRRQGRPEQRSGRPVQPFQPEFRERKAEGKKQESRFGQKAGRHSDRHSERDFDRQSDKPFKKPFRTSEFDSKPGQRPGSKNGSRNGERSERFDHDRGPEKRFGKSSSQGPKRGSDQRDGARRGPQGHAKRGGPTGRPARNQRSSRPHWA